MSANFGTITLMGSGELTDSMVKTHRNLLVRLGESARPVFLDTPAGFELNVDEISARAVDYFKKRLYTDLQVVSFKSRHTATEVHVEDALNKLVHANYIFAGPGSPSYAVSQWYGTPIWEMVIKRWQSGAHLVFASAAAISIGHLALPVYEIFKAGHDVCWMKGFDLLGHWGLALAIIPHWNNAEGRSFDTRYCFMGEPRLKLLEQQFEPGIAILGIDEHTAITFDPATKSCAVAGSGQVIFRYSGREKYFSSGSIFPFDELRVTTMGKMQNDEAFSSDQTLPPLKFQITTQYLEQLTRAMQSSGSEPQVHRELINHAHDTMHELAEGWRELDNLMPDQMKGALIQVLMATRARLRAVRQFALADQLRDDLAKVGILLQDTPTGMTWKHVESKSK